MSDKIWNGGTTNKSKEKAIREWNRLLRASEDFYDEVDSETTFRDELVEREKMMKEQEKQNPIKSKFGDYNRKNQINKMMDKPVEIGRMGGKGGPVEAIKARNEKK